MRSPFRWASLSLCHTPILWGGGGFMHFLTFWFYKMPQAFLVCVVYVLKPNETLNAQLFDRACLK